MSESENNYLQVYYNIKFQKIPGEYNQLKYESLNDSNKIFIANIHFQYYIRDEKTNLILGRLLTDGSNVKFKEDEKGLVKMKTTLYFDDEFYSTISFTYEWQNDKILYPGGEITTIILNATGKYLYLIGEYITINVNNTTGKRLITIKLDKNK